jgi:hypothetical protein
MNRVLAAAVLVLVSLAGFTGSASASQFGAGVFGADVPFGSATSLSANLGSNVSISLTPSGNLFVGDDNHTITITSTDVVGYALYVRALSTTDLVNGAATIPTSANSSPAALATNTWGWNTTGSSTNFQRMMTSAQLVKQAAGPYKLGDNTTVTYGAKADITKDAGTYAVNVIYMAVPLNP